jgi:hypothetical protein
VCNKIWEVKIQNKTKPNSKSLREEKEKWIRAKYEHMEFLAPLKTSARLEQQLLEAVTKNDVVAVALILAHCTNGNSAIATCYNRDLKTPLHIASENCNLAIVQLLIWNNANVKAFDADGRTALFYAKSSKEVEDLLKQHGCVDIVMPNRETSLARRLSPLSPKSEVFDKLPASVI